MAISRASMTIHLLRASSKSIKKKSAPKKETVLRDADVLTGLDFWKTCDNLPGLMEIDNILEMLIAYEAAEASRRMHRKGRP
ncbi:MAG: hypothetical protein ACJ73N_03145 [Bryobacteraceae bacterium]